MEAARISSCLQEGGWCWWWGLPCALGPREATLMSLLTVYLFLLHWPANPISKFDGIWCFMYARYWFFVSSVILNTQGFIPVVNNIIKWFVLVTLGLLFHICIFKASAIILCLYFWKHLLKSLVFFNSLQAMIAWHVVLAHMYPSSGVTLWLIHRKKLIVC